ncbi:MAG TPA: MBL fold metallo-hydrolase [Gaiella sp.]|jgi:glyoxylase-like metal-dependent hydrolase (beta-lactamase superfamily II)
MAAEAPPPPVIENDPTEVAEGVHVIPDGRVPLVPNVGIVVGERSALVVDTGMGPRNAATVRRHAERLATGRRLFLTLTHFHPEHAYGAQAFADGAVSLYNRAQLDDLRQKGSGYLELFKTFGDAVAAELEGVELVEPDVVYDTAAELDLGGRQVELRARGRGHTLGDQTVFLPAQRVLFTGDLVEERCFAIFPWFPPDDVDVDGHRWIEVLRELERLEPAIVVPGHGDIGGVEVIATAREYIEQLRDETERLAGAGRSEDEVAAELDRSFRELHPDWAQPEWIDFGARCFYEAYTREASPRS